MVKKIMSGIFGYRSNEKEKEEMDNERIITPFKVPTGMRAMRLQKSTFLKNILNNGTIPLFEATNFRKLEEPAIMGGKLIRDISAIINVKNHVYSANREKAKFLGWFPDKYEGEIYITFEAALKAACSNFLFESNSHIYLVEVTPIGEIEGQRIFNIKGYDLYNLINLTDIEGVVVEAVTPNLQYLVTGTFKKYVKSKPFGRHSYVTIDRLLKPVTTGHYKVNNSKAVVGMIPLSQHMLDVMIPQNPGMIPRWLDGVKHRYYLQVIVPEECIGTQTEPPTLYGTIVVVARALDSTKDKLDNVLGVSPLFHCILPSPLFNILPFTYVSKY